MEPEPEEESALDDNLKDAPKSRIPIPSSLYVQAGRSNYLADLSDLVYREEEKELDEAKKKLLQKKRKRKRGDGDEVISEDDGYGPPGILHTGRGKGKVRKRPSSELGDSSIELLGPSASLETDESDGTGDLLTESLEYDEEGVRKEGDSLRESRSATGFRRYSIKQSRKERNREFRKSKTVGEEVEGDDGDFYYEDEFEEGEDDSGNHLSPAAVREYKRYGEKSGHKGGRDPRERTERKGGSTSPGRSGGEERNTNEKRQRGKSEPGFERIEERRGGSKGERKGESGSTRRRGKSPEREQRYDDRRDGKEDSGFQRYGEKEGRSDKKLVRSKATEGKSPVRDDWKRSEEKRGKRGKSHGKDKTPEKWSRQPGRELTSAGGSRTPSKSPSKSPAERVGVAGDKITGRSPRDKKSKDRKDVPDRGERYNKKDGFSPKRYTSKEPTSEEKVGKWKEDIDAKTGGHRKGDGQLDGRKAYHRDPHTARKVDPSDKWSRTEAKQRKPGERAELPGEPGYEAGVEYAVGTDGGGGGDDDDEHGGKKDRKKRSPKEPDIKWDPKEKYDPDEDWKKELASKPPKLQSGVYAQGLPPEELEKRLQEDAVRDTAAGMRLLQLCQSGDWYGVDGHLRYFEKRVQTGQALNIKPLADLKDESTGWTPLMFAIKDNRIPLADRMLDLGSDVNAMAKDGFYPIHLAALFGRDDTIRFLIYKKADVTVVTDVKKQNVLHIACARQAGNSASILRALMAALPKEARLERDADGNIPLFIALKNGLKAACQELLGQLDKEQLAMTCGEIKDTPLHLATRKKDLEICRLLIDAGANVDGTNEDGQTPLFVACELGDENLCKYLYLCKANPHLADKEERTPIHIAAINGHTQLIDLLADKFKVSVFERTKDGSTLMHIASLHGHPETAMALFRKGVPLQMPNKNGSRSIHTAARHGHAHMISKLLEKGEKVDAVTNDNFTALHIATEAIRPNVVETLLGYGAQVHVKGGRDQETPLHIASRVIGGEKCALMLLKSGADPNITMENGETPLHVAARHGRLKIIQLLLMEGGNPQQRAKEGDTPLHLACRYGHYRVVQVLLEHVRRTKTENECTLYINMVTTKGETALHYSSRLNPGKITLNESEADLKKEEVGRDIVKLLLDGGASVSRLTKEANETCFHYACREGNNDILKEMLSRLNPVECQRALNRQSSKGWSPLLIACRRGHTGVVSTLLDFHARVDVFDTEGRSGLHLAAENGYQEICGILLEHKAFINAKSRVGLTALHLAATKGFTRLCLFLINDHGAAVDALTLKKQTPLHLAAEAGQLEVCRLLMGLRANPDATDDKGQKPIHLAAQNNHAEVIKLFLKHSPQLVNSFTKDGSTCAHLAAMQGSVAVLEELMKFDKSGVINARNRSTDATALQLAAEGGHAELVKTLLAAGASASDENRAGYTAAHLSAKNGHTHVLEALRHAQEDSINITSRKLGLSALHIASYYGQTETVRELLQFIAATSATDPPLTVATAFIKELGTESALTPLHMASYSGEENVVRLLLNFEGVQVDAPTANFGFNPLHLACRGGHITVVGLLLSRSSELLESKDASGKASLHIAAINGHKHMAEVLLGQGAEIDAIDKELWTPLICAAKSGHLDVVKLLVESGASPLAKTAKGQSAIWFAAAENHTDVLAYLMKKDHDTYGLMEDKDFVFNLCVCGKNIDNEPIDEFVLGSPAPVDVAAKMSSFLVYVSTREKERAKDLIAASKHCEAMATELLALASAAETPEKILEAVDRKGVEFLDVLIENEQKEVIAHTVVQRHLQEIWVGHLDWADWKLLLMFFSFVFCPPIWITFRLD